MARRRHTPEQVVRKLREADRLLAEGKDVAEVARHLQVSEQTYHRWRAQFGGMKADDVKRLKELEVENRRLKRIVADKELENVALQGDREGKLVSPSRRRRAVHMLQQRLGLSQRRACQIVGQHRSTQRHDPAEPDPDRDAAGPASPLRQGPSAVGVSPGAPVLCREGIDVNRKKIQRLWREEGLRVPPRRHKRRRVGISTTPADRLAAERPDHVWALDYQFDVTSTGRTIKILHVVDECTRESLADVVGYRSTPTRPSPPSTRSLATRGDDAGVRADGQRSRTHRQRVAGLVPVLAAPARATSIPDHRGRTPGSSPTGQPDARRVARDRTVRHACTKPKCLSPTGATSTTLTVPTARSACSPQPRSLTAGGPNTNQHSHNGWTATRGRSAASCPDNG